MSFITEKILEILKDEAVALSEIANAMMCSRPESYRRLRELNSCDTRIHDRKKASEEDACERKRIYDMLRHLKRGGFISSKDREDGSSWIITGAGLEKLKSLKNKSKDLKSYLDYTREKADKLVIVAFDIPERLRYHRAWLRDALKFLGFNLFQKSVWMGNVAIPEDFISDLKRKGIAGYVDIFEAGSKGTLNRLA